MAICCSTFTFVVTCFTVATPGLGPPPGSIFLLCSWPLCGRFRFTLSRRFYMLDWEDDPFGILLLSAQGFWPRHLRLDRPSSSSPCKSSAKLLIIALVI